MQESIHAAWLENSLASFQSHLLDALLTAARNLHTPLSRANMQQQQQQPSGNSFPRATAIADNNSSAQIKTALMNQVLLHFNFLFIMTHLIINLYDPTTYLLQFIQLTL